MQLSSSMAPMTNCSFVRNLLPCGTLGVWTREDATKPLYLRGVRSHIHALRCHTRKRTSSSEPLNAREVVGGARTCLDQCKHVTTKTYTSSCTVCSSLPGVWPASIDLGMTYSMSRCNYTFINEWMNERRNERTHERGSKTHTAEGILRLI